MSAQTPVRPLTVKQVAEAFAVSPETVVAWAETGRLRGFRTPSKRWRFHQAEVDAYLAATNGTAS
jgi:excisionase family DNA binding protein